MSRQLTVLRINQGIRSVSELDGEMIGVLGTLASVTNMVRGLFPQADFTDPHWIVIDENGYSMIVSLPMEEVISSAAIHIYNTESLKGIKQLGLLTGWSFFDPVTGDFLDLESI